MAKTEEDWFLRGGEKPSTDTEGCGNDPVCQNCGSCWPTDVGETCPICGASLTGGASTAEYCGAPVTSGIASCGKMNFKIRIERTRSVDEVAEVWVAADDCDEAVDIAEDMYDSGEITGFSEVEETEDCSEPTFEAMS